MDVQFLIVFLLVAICAEPIGMSPMQFLGSQIPASLRTSSPQFNHEVSIVDSNGTIVLGSVIDEGRSIVAPAKVFDDWKNSHIAYTDAEGENITVGISACEQSDNRHLVVLTPSTPNTLLDNAIEIKETSGEIVDAQDYDARVSNHEGPIIIDRLSETMDKSKTIRTNYLGDLPLGTSLILHAKRGGSQFLIGEFDHTDDDCDPKESVFATVTTQAIRKWYDSPLLFHYDSDASGEANNPAPSTELIGHQDDN